MNLRSQSGIFCENVLMKDVETRNIQAINIFLLRTVTIAFLYFYILRLHPDTGLLLDPVFVF